MTKNEFRISFVGQALSYCISHMVKLHFLDTTQFLEASTNTTKVEDGVGLLL